MSGAAFSIIEPDIRYPAEARDYARNERLGFPTLAAAFKGHPAGSLGETISMREFFPDRGLDIDLEDGASFPDDSVLLMIGNTKELEDACKEAETARILAIYTKTQQKLGLLYARVKVHWLSGQEDTLIAIGPQGLLPPASQDGWHDYPGWQGPPTYVTTLDGAPPALPPIIRWIKQNDGNAWVKA
jgi:hypothetical protein